MKIDSELVREVGQELFFDPRVTDSGAIAVESAAGAVTLRGAVGSFHQKRAAAAAARRVKGATSVRNELQVRLMTEARRDDADIRGAALQALALDGVVPADALEVKVYDGRLTLTGYVPWHYQREAAEEDVALLHGVVDIDDQIVVENDATAADVADRISSAFFRNAQLRGSDIKVSADDGFVTLRGTVGSWAEHDEAMGAAWSAPGVSHVRDDLEVAY